MNYDWTHDSEAVLFGSGVHAEVVIIASLCPLAGVPGVVTI